jgi:hypothetical protein
MRDLPASLDLLALGRELLLTELVPLLPPARERDARLIATVIEIVLREAQGEDWQQAIAAQVRQLYRSDEAGDAGLHRFATDLRNGAFENSPSRAAAARAILWRLTIAKLRENNPHFLVANGIAATGERSE